jgi:hypothetical protein
MIIVIENPALKATEINTNNEILTPAVCHIYVEGRYERLNSAKELLMTPSLPMNVRDTAGKDAVVSAHGVRSGVRILRK